MFFTGSLQEGISAALQQSKQVVCFVTDDGSESEQWENEFLTDDSIRSGLVSRSILLRLSAGSQEAGYLEALFPVPKKPTVVIIRDGQLKEYIAAGTSKEEFIRRIGKTNEPSLTAQSQASTTTSVNPELAATPPQRQPQPAAAAASTAAALNNYAQPAPSSSPSTPSGPTEEEKRLAAAERAKAKGKGRAEPSDEDSANTNTNTNTAEKSHANEIKLRKQQANEERKRILQRIEDDKRARKERDAAERQARLSLSNPVEPSGSTTTSTSELRQRNTKASQNSEHCNLQVRLLDGSTLRSRFASDATLGKEVRGWIDAARTDGGRAPYSFRVVLTPQPNKVVEPQEEIKSLLSLGLAPSATLVLIPTRYGAVAGRGGVLSPIIGIFSSLIAAIMAAVGGFFGLFFGGGGGSGGGDGRDDDEVQMEAMQNRRRDRDAQFYNGNSLSFEPRNDEDDDDDHRR
ncbi:hypothetical protein F4808DRAFT_363072 [Astrocystis sublimbata]|nr:hypothetical protein F4808DRAFT_363072 [Astrocystis sublimbata]